MELSTHPDPAHGDGAFLLRDALGGGQRVGALRHPRWHSPFSGVRSRQPTARTLRGRTLQYVPRLRKGERFSHATALALLGCPIRVPAQSEVDVSSPRELGQVRCRGVTGHRHRGDASEYHCAVPEYEDWLPIVEPLEAVRQAALQLPFPELVVALDFLLLDGRGRFDSRTHVSAEQLARFAAEASGRGAVRFRAAAALARAGAESRMETLMRLGHVRAGGPELRLQAELHDAQGCWIGRYDAVDDTTLSIFEYDGEQHLTSLRQRRRDARKLQAARDAGWRVRVLYAEDVLGRLLDTGRMMLAFSGRETKPVPRALAMRLDECSGEETESAIPREDRPRG